MALVNPLYIHGWGFSSKVFKEFTGIKPDLPGHGRNTSPYRGLDEVVGYLADLIRDRSDIVGWSMGASLALLLALKYPERVRRIFLIGGTPCFRRAWKESNLRAFRLMIRKRGISAFRELAGFENFNDSVQMETLLRMLDDYINLDLSGKLGSVRSKVLIIHGEEDRVVPPSEALKLKDELPDSDVIILKGGHFPLRNERDLIQAVFQVR